MTQHPSTHRAATLVARGGSQPESLVVERTLSMLTPRQRQVFLLIGEGRMYAEIARALRLSRCRVTQHRWHIVRKLGLGTKAELLQVAVTVRVQLDRPFVTELPGKRR